jgi:hypothetical protein
VLQASNGLLGKLFFVYVAVASVIEDLDNWLWARKTGIPRHFKHRGGKQKTILQAEGEKS